MNPGTASLIGSASIATISGNGTLAVGNLNQNGTLQFNPNAGPSDQSGLTVGPHSAADLTNNEFFINYDIGSDPIATIAAYIRSGYNHGAWNGPGIISSTARTPTNGLYYGLGYADGADGVVADLFTGQIEIKYTLLGDANLDGVVNGSDFSILAANFGEGVSGWDKGDFNYDGVVNGTDFSALAANFGLSASGAAVSVSPADVAALEAFAKANGLAAPDLTNVPEPAGGVACLSWIVAVLPRRRRVK